MFEHLKKVNAWIELDGTYDLGPGPAIPNETGAGAIRLFAMHDMRLLPRGMSAVSRGQLHRPAGDRPGAAMNMHPTGKMTEEERLNGLMDDDGITNCGNAQNCVQVCPMSIPLTKAIYETNRDITVDALFGWLKK